MTIGLALLLFWLSLLAYAVAAYFIIRWMFVRRLTMFADRMEGYYKPTFIDGIRYSSHVVKGDACEGMAWRKNDD